MILLLKHFLSPVNRQFFICCRVVHWMMILVEISQLNVVVISCAQRQILAFNCIDELFNPFNFSVKEKFYFIHLPVSKVKSTRCLVSRNKWWSKYSRRWWWHIRTWRSFSFPNSKPTTTFWWIISDNRLHLIIADCHLSQLMCHWLANMKSKIEAQGTIQYTLYTWWFVFLPYFLLCRVLSLPHFPQTAGLSHLFSFAQSNSSSDEYYPFFLFLFSICIHHSRFVCLLLISSWRCSTWTNTIILASSIYKILTEFRSHLRVFILFW